MIIYGETRNIDLIYLVFNVLRFSAKMCDVKQYLVSRKGLINIVIKYGNDFFIQKILNNQCFRYNVRNFTYYNK